MLNVLVPTDFSDNSKSGLRFAMQWSRKQNIRLIFIHAFHVLKAPLSTDLEFKKFIDREKSSYEKRLNKFVLSLYKSLRIKPGKYSCVVRQGISADLSILGYCQEKGKINYICIATRGANGIDKMLGTNTSNLITKSDVPVLSIPQNYRKHNLRKLLYPADFVNIDNDLEQIVSFARPLDIEITILHLASPGGTFRSQEAIQAALRKKYHYNIDVYIKKTNIKHSIRENIQEYVKNIKPSIMALSTDQNRSLFQKLFYPSRAAQISFTTTIPLLTFPKSNSLVPVKTKKNQLLNDN